MRVNKKVIALLIILALAAGLAPTTLAMGASFSDVPSSHWAYDVITKWSAGSYGVLEGNGDGTFSPSSGLSVGELAAILTRTFGYSERVSAKVEPSWAAEYVEKAVAAGVIEKAASIDAGAMLTREQAVRYIALAYGVSPEKGSTSFIDDSAIGDAYKPYVNAFQKLGYVIGKGNNDFDPQGRYTRAEAMKVLDNITGEIADTTVSGNSYEKDLIIRKSGVTVEKTTVKGNLIVAQGVGDGEVVLDNVKVEGKLIAYGGGAKSIVIKGASEINTVVLNKGFGEPVHLSVEGDSYVTTCEVAAGSGAIISGSTIMTLSVEANAEVTITEGSVLAKVEINGANVILTIEKDGIITELTISADGNVDVEGEGSVTTTITIQSDGTTSTSSGETGSQGDGGNQGGSSQVADSGNQSGGGGSQGGGEPTAPIPTPKYGFLVDELTNVVDNSGRGTADFITTDGTRETLTITATSAIEVSISNTRFYKLIPDDPDYIAVPQYLVGEAVEDGVTFGDVTTMEITMAMFTLEGANNTNSFHSYSYARGGMSAVFIHEDYETPGDMYGTNNVGLDYAYNQAKDAGIVFVIHERIGGVNTAQATFVINWQADRTDFDGSSLVRPEPTPKYGFLVSESANVLDGAGRAAAEFITTDGVSETLTITATTAMNVTNDTTRFYKLVPVPGGTEWNATAVPHTSDNDFTLGYTFGDINPLELTSAMFTLIGVNNTDNFHIYNYASGGMRTVFVHEDYETPGDMYGTNNVGLDYAYRQAKDAGIVFVIHEQDSNGVNRAQATFVVNWQADRINFGTYALGAKVTP